MTAVKVNQRRGFRVRLASSMFLAPDKTRKSRELPFSWLNNKLYLSVNVFGSKLLIEDIISMSPTILLGYQGKSGSTYTSQLFQDP